MEVAQVEKDPRHFKGNEEDPGLAQVGYIASHWRSWDIKSFVNNLNNCQTLSLSMYFWVFLDCGSCEYYSNDFGGLLYHREKEKFWRVMWNNTSEVISMCYFIFVTLFS